MMGLIFVPWAKARCRLSTGVVCLSDGCASPREAWCTFIDDTRQPSALALTQAELPKCSHHRIEPHHGQRRHVIGNNRGRSFLPSAFARVSSVPEPESEPVAGNKPTCRKARH